MKLRLVIEICMDAVFGTDAWMVLLALIVQDFPFLIIRIIIAACFSLEKNYSLYYLCGKNVLLCMLEVYRVVVLMYEKAKEELKEIKEEANESGHIENGSKKNDKRIEKVPIKAGNTPENSVPTRKGGVI